MADVPQRANGWECGFHSLCHASRLLARAEHVVAAYAGRYEGCKGPVEYWKRRSQEYIGDDITGAIQGRAEVQSLPVSTQP